MDSLLLVSFRYSYCERRYFACIHFRGFMKLGNFACNKICVLCIIGSIGYYKSNFHHNSLFSIRESGLKGREGPFKSPPHLLVMGLYNSRHLTSFGCIIHMWTFL